MSGRYLCVPYMEEIGTGRGVAEMDWAKGCRLAHSFISTKTNVDLCQSAAVSGVLRECSGDGETRFEGIAAAVVTNCNLLVTWHSGLRLTKLMGALIWQSMLIWQGLHADIYIWHNLIVESWFFFFGTSGKRFIDGNGWSSNFTQW